MPPTPENPAVLRLDRARQGNSGHKGIGRAQPARIACEARPTSRTATAYSTAFCGCVQYEASSALGSGPRQQNVRHSSPAFRGPTTGRGTETHDGAPYDRELDGEGRR